LVAAGAGVAVVARGVVRLRAIGRTGLRGPVADLRDVALIAARGAADGPLRRDAVRRAVGAGAATGLRHVAGIALVAAGRPPLGELIGRAEDAGPGTVLGDVAGTRRGATERPRVASYVPADAEGGVARVDSARVQVVTDGIVRVALRALPIDGAIGRIGVRLLRRVRAAVDHHAARAGVGRCEAAVHLGVLAPAAGRAVRTAGVVLTIVPEVGGVERERVRCENDRAGRRAGSEHGIGAPV